MAVADRVTLDQLLRVLGALRSVGCSFWISGGWGVDALVGHQTRPHRDVDVDVDAAYQDEVLEALGELGYVVETDWRPTRVELAAPGRGWVDVHPFVLEPGGRARQAALGGGWHRFPASYFTVGRIGGMEVPCVSVEAQRRFHEGYEPREVDRHDLALLDRLEGPLWGNSTGVRGNSTRMGGTSTI